LNVERARLDKMLESKEIKSLIIALGTAIGEEFDEKKLRYHRIILMADADSDGRHIVTLLLTLFYRHFLPIIEKGYLYIANPPLYKIQAGKIIQYAYSEAEKERIVAELKKQKIEKDKARQIAKTSATSKTQAEAESNESAEEKTEVKGIEIQRYKGLGEMNPEELRETTLDPAKRTLKRVTVEDAAEADRIFDILMGNEVLPRKKFIQTHAKTVKNLDI